MPSKLAMPGIKFAKKVLALQSLIVIFCTVVALFFGVTSALSALLGGLAAVLPNIVFAVLAFRFVGASKNQLVYNSFKTGSKLKLILTIVIFLLIYRWPDVQAGPLFITFVIALLGHYVVGAKNHYSV
ncbi:ATP synthase subunit I [Alteromonas sp. a30]|uniref:ATP synthase subunit I n=1 Tax=Alteromonas sp. a30 TaxID=2730917 RepID=UPI00228174DE|nr:ATP synthase subunit I [Alteromonas sp. a30]